MKVKCLIQKYDPNITKPPYKFIDLDVVTILDTTKEEDSYGIIRVERIENACEALGYKMRFYTLSSKRTEYKYIIVVRGELEQRLGII